MIHSTSKVRVALLFGGRSGEHAISCVTAGSVLGAIDRQRFEPIPVGITKAGRLVLAPDDPARWRLGQDTLPQLDDAGPEVLLPSSTQSAAWRVVDPASGVVTSLGVVDVAFPLLHGPYGEDGTIQGALELLDIAYVGSGTLASAIGMDKEVAKAIFAAHGLPVASSVLVTPQLWAAGQTALTEQIAALGWPVFVKPSRAGSSLGVSKVAGLAELAPALELAWQCDPRVLVEQAQVGREIECAVLGGRGGAPARAAGPAEIVIHPEHQFYSFEAKYLDTAAADLQCPANLPTAVAARVRRLAIRAFEAIEAEGLSRVDFFYNPDAPAGQDLVVNEINTMPGFTPISLYPRMWAAAGLDYSALISELIDLALERPLGLR